MIHYHVSLHGSRIDYGVSNFKSLAGLGRERSRGGRVESIGVVFYASGIETAHGAGDNAALVFAACFHGNEFEDILAGHRAEELI